MEGFQYEVLMIGRVIYHDLSIAAFSVKSVFKYLITDWTSWGMNGFAIHDVLSKHNYLSKKESFIYARISI